MQPRPGLSQRVRELVRLTLQRGREGHLSAIRQLCEMAILRLRFGIGPSYYHIAGFWNRRVPWAEKTAHLGADSYAQCLQQLNPINYRKLSQNKISEKGILSVFKVPTPRFLGYLHPSHGRSAEGSPLRTCEELEAMLRRTESDAVCFKLIEGWGGAGFIAAEVIRESTRMKLRKLFTGDAMDLAAFWDSELAQGQAHGRIVEEYQRQHENFAAVNPTSVNTLRIWVIRRRGQPPATIGAYLRIGRAGSLVDNQTSGGIVAAVDLKAGTLKAALDGMPTHRVFPTHPDHGAPIEGHRLIDLDAATALCERVLGLFPNTGFAGFDVAMTTSGPVIIELNVTPDLEGAVYMGIAPKPWFDRD